MYFWNINNLKADLASNKVSQRDLFYYLVISLLVSVAGSELLFFLPQEQFNHWDILNSSLMVLITFFGILWTYKCNSGNLGDNFLERFISIGWVTVIRLIIFLFLILFTLYFIIELSSETAEDTILETQWWEVLAFQAWHSFVYFKSGKHIKDVAQANKVQ